ncbi:hypothetical protein DFH11DRAFT_1626028 [Phellopilus nigrolimitatus]|nr:hypothetical protein DFH11DRAFT_1626028 [Phellopilus nigrolimitatus]
MLVQIGHATAEILKPRGMHRVLSVLELLNFIFSYLDRHTHASCARVCKRWTGVALDLLWEELDEVVPLLSILAPLGSDQSEPVKDPLQMYSDPAIFTRSTNDVDWENFYSYSRRVRRLRVDFLRSIPLSTRIFAEITQEAPSYPLLPNLSKLAICCLGDIEQLSIGLIFAHESVKELRIAAPKCSTPWTGMEDFFDEVTQRMPHLETIFLSVPDVWSVSEIEPCLNDFLLNMPRLKTLFTPIYFATSSIVTTLSKLPSLVSIDFGYPPAYGSGSPVDVTPFSPELLPGSFPALMSLGLCATILDSSRFFENKIAPTTITSLHIHSPKPDADSTIGDFLCLISRTCPFLRSLSMNLISQATISNTALRNTFTGELLDEITLDTLIPITYLPELVNFKFSYHRPILLTDDDLEKLVSQMPRLEELRLCSDPILMHFPSRLTLASLSSVAHHCPRMRSLALYMNTRILEPLPYLAKPGSLRPVRFQNIESINVGTSLIEVGDMLAIATFLGSLLPDSKLAARKVRIEYGVSWVPAVSYVIYANDKQAAQTVQILMRRWAQIARMLPVAVEARAREQTRVEGLEKELEELRGRMAILEGSILDASR